MNQSANRAFRHFAGNRSLQDTPIEKLKTLAAGYPYFPVAQFFLAKKLKDEDDDNYISQSQKAVLYFSNPFLFDHLLNAEIVTENVEEEPEANEPPGNEPLIENHEAQPSTFNDTDLATETAEEMAGNEERVSVETDNFLTESSQVSSEDNVAEDVESIKPEEPDEHEKMFRSIKAMLDATSEEADADVNNTEIPIDPYYTIDYFASQGIKLDLEVNPDDKLGQNLKKFTHWLRHMKKLGPEDAKVEIESSEAEADVKKMADSSNSVREVVTEAMASVLEKQGKKDKAIELYNKLSFLNPDKSAYFAAKIENLKGN